MLFDGTTVLPETPLERLMRAADLLDGERRAARKAARGTITPIDAARQRRHKARLSVAVLDKLNKLFAGGWRWMRGDLTDDDGRYCLLGGLTHVRALNGRGDHAGWYLSRAIFEQSGRRLSIIQFNDMSQFPRIKAVIARARELAQADATS